MRFKVSLRTIHFMSVKKVKLLSAFQQNIENLVATIEKAEQDIIIRDNNNKNNIKTKQNQNCIIYI